MTSRAADTVRVFNRFYTRLVGVLNDEHLGTGLPLGEARVLFEIGQLAPIEAKGLETHLALDAGYLSRQLAALEKRGLIKRTAEKTDTRRKRITLTAKGKKKLAQLDAVSDQAATKLVKKHDAAKQERLINAMLEVQRLLDDEPDIEDEPADSSSARACLNAYFAELERRFPEGFDASNSVSADVDEVTPPRGAFLLVRVGGRPRGCGAVKVLEHGIGEVKRMWIHPELRGRGMGRALLDALESRARKLGVKRVRLDTSAHLPEAIRLYVNAGYREIPPYNDNAYAAHWFEKSLTAKSR
ncbi:MAG: GNAT family N-acetyltransferase [Archangium sp.]